MTAGTKKKKKFFIMKKKEQIGVKNKGIPGATGSEGGEGDGDGDF